MPITIAFAALAVTCFAHIVTIALVMRRMRKQAAWSPAAPDPAPPVSIVRPMRGLENHLEACLESGFRLAYPNYELIFCAEDARDPAVALARRLIEAYPEVRASVAIGRDDISANPKLNNVVKGWRAAKSDWVVLSDSNTILPADYIERLWSYWDDETGCVSAVFEAGMTDGFASELECAFINSLHARWVWAADSLGLGFALGKTLMYHRPTLERLGGLPRLAQSAAEDIATTHTMREAGLDVHLSQRIVQPIGRKTFRSVFQRQIRWARLRRSGLRGIYAAEILNGGLIPIGSATGLAIAGAIPAAAAIGVAVGWYALELTLIRAARWPLSLTMPAALVLRDLLIPPVWLAGLFGNRFEWRGNAMTVSKPREEDQTFEAEAG